MSELLLLERLVTNNELNTNYTPTCFDGKIHIRLKNYKANECLTGFEAKLSFLIQYLLQHFIINFRDYEIDFKAKGDDEVIKDYIFSKYINEFKVSDEYKHLIYELSSMLDFKDIIIKKAYSKKLELTKYTQFGNLNELLSRDVDIVSIVNYPRKFLFNDNISILITDDFETNPNKKFENKAIRKLEKDLKKSNGFKESDLW